MRPRKPSRRFRAATCTPCVSFRPCIAIRSRTSVWQRCWTSWPPNPHRVAFVHCGVLSVGVRKKLGLPSPFDMRFSNPIDLHAVASRYPQVRFIVPHFGAGYFREALMLCDLCPNVYLDTSSSNSWTRYEEAHLDLRTVFRRALDVAGPQTPAFRHAIRLIFHAAGTRRSSKRRAKRCMKSASRRKRAADFS